jgi:hypothetical protein
VERAAPQPGELLQVKQQVQAEIVGPREALLPAAGRIAEGVGDERHGRRDAVIFQPGAQAIPVAEQVCAGQGQLERRWRQGAGAGGIRMKLSINSRRKFNGFVLLAQARPQYLCSGLSFS